MFGHQSRFDRIAVLEAIFASGAIGHLASGSSLTSSASMSCSNTAGATVARPPPWLVGLV